MKAEICKWYGGAAAPVVLMIDDFCNVWVDTNGNGLIDPGEDWGFAGREHGSSLVFLEDKLLKDFPGVKVTFFIPVGIRIGVIESPVIPFISEMINSSPEKKAFFHSVGSNPRYEAAYHGTTHGKPGKEAKDFIHEWEIFTSLDHAKKVIQSGKEIFKEVFGVYPAGGKYCGYVSNSFSDDSIVQSGFSWWCRYDNAGLKSEKLHNGESGFNKLENYDIKYFGNTNVVDIPTTLYGSLFKTILNPGAYNLKGLVKRILKPLIMRVKLRKLDFLLENNLVVCIQEHIAHARADGKQQMPNIFDDLDSLREILRHLSQKQVWYCTCSELAHYVKARDAVTIESCSRNTFSIRTKSPGTDGCTLTIRFSNDHETKIIQPDGTQVNMCNRLADIRIMSGVYALI